MGSLTSLLKLHEHVALDTCVWIYHFGQHPDFSVPAARLLGAIASGQCRGSISELVLMELVTGPLKLGRQDIADEYEILLDHFPNLSILPLSRTILLDAARIRAIYGFRTPDALMLATACAAGASLMVTNDVQLKKFSELQVLCLGDLSERRE